MDTTILACIISAMNEPIEKPADLGQSKPTKTWFIERGDGFVFACNESEAWGLFHNRTEWMRRDFKILGVSDGKTYFETIRKSKEEIVNLKERLATLKEAKAKYTKTEDRMRFEELLDDDHEKVQKVVQLLEKTQKEISEVEKKIKTFNQDVINKAFNAELDKARGNIEMPSNGDVITPQESQRQKILNSIG